MSYGLCWLSWVTLAPEGPRLLLAGLHLSLASESSWEERLARIYTKTFQSPRIIACECEYYSPRLDRASLVWERHTYVKLLGD